MKVLKEKGKFRITRVDDLLFVSEVYEDDINYIHDTPVFTPQTRITVQQHIRIACVGMWITIKQWVHNGDDKSVINYNIELAKELFDLIVE